MHLLKKLSLLIATGLVALSAQANDNTKSKGALQLVVPQKNIIANDKYTADQLQNQAQSYGYFIGVKYSTLDLTSQQIDEFAKGVSEQLNNQAKISSAEIKAASAYLSYLLDKKVQTLSKKANQKPLVKPKLLTLDPFYVVGAVTASQYQALALNNDNAELFIEAFKQGVKLQDGNQDLKSFNYGIVEPLSFYYNTTIEKEREKIKKQKELKIAAGEKMEAAFAKQKGVKKHPSGFYYKILQVGKGLRVRKDNTDVTLALKAVYPDGKVILDSAVDKKSYKVDFAKLPKGLQDAIKIIQTGGAIEIILPPSLGYGNNSSTFDPDSYIRFYIQQIRLSERNK